MEAEACRKLSPGSLLHGAVPGYQMNSLLSSFRDKTKIVPATHAFSVFLIVSRRSLVPNLTVNYKILAMQRSSCMWLMEITWGVFPDYTTHTPLLQQDPNRCHFVAWLIICARLNGFSCYTLLSTCFGSHDFRIDDVATPALSQHVGQVFPAAFRPFVL